MQTFLLSSRLLLVAMIAAVLSGCTSGGSWSSPLAFWRTNPFSSSAPTAPPSQLAGNTAPGTGYAPLASQNRAAAPTHKATAPNGYMTPPTYPRTDSPNPITLASHRNTASTTAGSAYAPQNGLYGTGSTAGRAGSPSYGNPATGGVAATPGYNTGSPYGAGTTAGTATGDYRNTTGSPGGYVPANTSGRYAGSSQVGNDLPPVYNGTPDPATSAGTGRYPTTNTSTENTVSTPSMADAGPRYGSNPAAPPAPTNYIGSGVRPGETPNAPGRTDYNPPGYTAPESPPLYTPPGMGNHSAPAPYLPAGTTGYNPATDSVPNSGSATGPTSTPGMPPGYNPAPSTPAAPTRYGDYRTGAATGATTYPAPTARTAATSSPAVYHPASSSPYATPNVPYGGTPTGGTAGSQIPTEVSLPRVSLGQ